MLYCQFTVPWLWLLAAFDQKTLLIVHIFLLLTPFSHAMYFTSPLFYLSVIKLQYPFAVPWLWLQAVLVQMTLMLSCFLILPLHSVLHGCCFSYFYYGFISFHCAVTLAAGSICSSDISIVYIFLPQIPFALAIYITLALL